MISWWGSINYEIYRKSTPSIIHYRVIIPEMSFLTIIQFVVVILKTSIVRENHQKRDTTWTIRCINHHWNRLMNHLRSFCPWKSVFLNLFCRNYNSWKMIQNKRLACERFSPEGHLVSDRHNLYYYYHK